MKITYLTKAILGFIMNAIAIEIEIPFGMRFSNPHKTQWKTNETNYSNTFMCMP